MLPTQGNLPLSPYSELYDIIVPKDNKLRKIADNVDFSFIYDELKEKYCQDNGRMAEDPVRMFKYLFLKCLLNLSDVDLVSRAATDLSLKYFLGLAPESRVIEASTLCKFRKLRLSDGDLMEKLLGKSVQMAEELGLIKSKEIIVDATHTSSRSNAMKPILILKQRFSEVKDAILKVNPKAQIKIPIGASALKKSDAIDEIHSAIKRIESLHESKVPHVAEKINMLKETVSDIEDHYSVSIDNDARVGHKTKDTTFFGYKTHVAMTQEGFITAAVVTSGEKDDGKVLPELIEKTKDVLPEAECFIGDGAYASSKNLEYAKKENVTIVSKVNPIVISGYADKNDGFSYNKDAGMCVCPAGHMAIRKSTRKANCKNENKNKSDQICFHFDKRICRLCKRKSECGKVLNGKVKVYVIEREYVKEQIDLMETDYFREKYKTRYKIEAKNAELKNVLGYDRAMSYGLHAMQVQGAVTLFTANIKRIMTLMSQKDEK